MFYADYFGHCGRYGSMGEMGAEMKAGALIGAGLAIGLWAGPQALAGDFAMEPVTVLPYEPKVEPQVLGANKLDPADWPATLFFTGATGKRCTATVVGERVVLTAAHCVPNGAKGTVTVDGVSTDLLCDHHPDYVNWANRSADFALCLATNAFAELPFEVINETVDLVEVGDPLMILGYGCRDKNGKPDPYNLYGAAAPVTELPAADLFTTTVGGAAVCFGDSGGGSYFIDGPARFLVAIAALGDIDTASRLSTTATPAFEDWARTWMEQKGVSICGLSDDAVGCKPV